MLIIVSVPAICVKLETPVIPPYARIKLLPLAVNVTEFVIEPVLITLNVNPAWWDEFNSGNVIAIDDEPVADNINVCSNGNVKVSDVPVICLTSFNI